MILAVFSGIGVLLLLTPQLLGIHQSQTSSIFSGTPSEIFGFILCLAFSLQQAISRIYLTKISSSITLEQNIFYLHFGVLIVNVLLGGVLEVSISSIPYYVGIAILAYFFQIALFNATRLENNPSVVMIIQNSMVIFSFLYDSLLFGKTVRVTDVAGASIVIIASLAAIYERNRDKNS